MCAMNVLVTTDGSKYGRWGLNWAAKLPFVEPPKVTALHVLDTAMLRWPFRTRLETQRVEARAAKTLKRAKQQLVALKLKGTARKEQGAVASVILKHAPNQDGLLVVGSKGMNQIISAVRKRQNANKILADKHPDINQRRKPCLTNNPQVCH
jgi:nucleotide-binding universal stress UspA family protein